MSAPGLKEVNIKYDMPTVSDAIKRITYNIRNAKPLGVCALKIIHGYGSGGTGGKIRGEARRYLDGQRAKGYIKFYVTGEEFSIFSEATREAFKFCPELRRDPDLERHNNGVTFIIL